MAWGIEGITHRWGKAGNILWRIARVLWFTREPRLFALGFLGTRGPSKVCTWVSGYPWTSTLQCLCVFRKGGYRVEGTAWSVRQGMWN